MIKVENLSVKVKNKAEKKKRGGSLQEGGSEAENTNL